MNNDELILGVTRLLANAPIGIIPRIRIAVSFEEYQALEALAFARDGFSTDRVCNIPLYLDPSPDYTPLTVRYP